MNAYCGLECTKCDAFIATERNDDALRAKVAAEWAKMYGAPILPEHINCTGCRSEGIKVYYCEHMCQIRACAGGRAFETCADCGEFPCEKLNEVFHFAPHAKERLESLRKKSGDAMA